MVPEKIKIHRHSRTLEIVFKGKPFTLSAEYLRVFSPSAEVRGHGAGQETLQVDKEDVSIVKAEPQGRYAIKLTYSDGHDSGIYTWDYLYELAVNYETKWAEYKKKLGDYYSTSTPASEEASPLIWVNADDASLD